MIPRGDLPPELHRYTPASSVVETERPGELILLDAATQQMFTLNEAGKMIWRALPNRTLDGVATLFLEQFDVTHDDATSVVQALVTRLVDAGLLFPAND